jgi:arylsulfatase
MSSRNVILVTVDSVRADHCSFLNSDFSTTPTLEKLAEDSLVFENAIVPGPQTLSSVPAIHTGTPFPITDHDITSYEERISRIQEHIGTHRTISEMFSEMGYSTACVEANPWTSRTAGFDEGYDFFYDVGGEQRKHVSERFKETSIGSLIRVLSQWYHNDGWFSQWPHFYDRISSVIDELSEPYFLWIFLLDTHNPYFVGKEDRVESSALGMYYSLARANSVLGVTDKGSNYNDQLPPHVATRVERAYRDSIRSVDRFISKFLEGVSDDDPMLAFYSDHGEAFGDHGIYGHQHTVYEENIHVPFLVHNASVDGRISDTVSLLELPDILRELSIDDQVSPAEWTSEYVYSRTEDSSTIAVRGERWKYISSGERDELFDLECDPNEEVDVSSEEEDVLQELQSIKDKYVSSLPHKTVSSTSSDNEDLRERLDALGYVG